MSRATFGEVVRRLEQRLVGELCLDAQPLPPELARLEGTFRDEPATLLARCYSGPRLGYLRCVEVSSPSRLDIGNLLALPRAELALPLLGIDLVEVGRDTAVAVADLSPMTETQTGRVHELAVLERHLKPPCGERSALPEWAAGWFSAAALCVRVRPDQAQACAESVGAYVSAFIELVRAGLPNPAQAGAVARRQRAYLAAHRERDRGLLLLRRMFAPALADRLLCEVLFPTEAQS